LEWTVSVDSTIARPHQHAVGARKTTTGAGPNHENLPADVWSEPEDQALGRSRGWWTTRTHLAVDADGRPLAIRVGPGQGGDNPQLLAVLDEIAVPTGRLSLST
jgi:hypothetical protein